METKTEKEKTFERLPGHVIGNELYVAQRELTRFYEGLLAGNDFDRVKFNRILASLAEIKKQARKFTESEVIPISYQFTKK